MAGRKIEHLQEKIRQKLSVILRQEANDPRFARVTVTGVKLAKDQSFAKVHYACFPPESDPSSLTESLNRAAGFLGRAVGRTLQSRSTPRLRFEYDRGFDYSMEIDGLLAGLREDKE